MKTIKRLLHRLFAQDRKYTEADLVSFGKYLLSDERRKTFKSYSRDNLEERLSMVHHADLCNWEEKHK